jgi:hypothetical protein
VVCTVPAGNCEVRSLFARVYRPSGKLAASEVPRKLSQVAAQHRTVEVIQDYRTPLCHTADGLCRWVVTAYHRTDGALTKTQNPNRLQSKTYCQMQSYLRIDQRYLQMQRTAFVRNINKHGASHTTLTL